MARRLILATGVLIASERSHSDLAKYVDGDDDIAIAAVTVAELRTGVELASEARREARQQFVLRVLQTIPVEPYEQTTAEAHGRLLAHVHRAGTARGAHDLMIAATAIETDRTVLTTDRAARFDELPGVTCIVVE